MLDNRIYTFLELSSIMNYHKAAENLNMTQPAVSQHIRYLENFYQCKLFVYTNRKLQKTKQGLELERYARKIIALDLAAKEQLAKKEKLQINIGATKTIGDYTLNSVIGKLILHREYELNFIIDNTENLLNKLNHFELDLLLLEGHVDKEKYLHAKMSEQEMIGICALDHPFAFKEIDLPQILEQNIILREQGSGTRNILENFLLNHGYSLAAFRNKSIISSNKIIENIIKDNLAISFVYEVIQKQNPNLAYFRIAGKRIWHEFNFVFLNADKAQGIIDLIGVDE